MYRTLLPMAVAVGLLAGCVPEKPEIVARSSAGSEAQVAAVVGSETFTAKEVRSRIDAMPEFARVRFATDDRKKTFLATLVQFELLADAAEKQGYDEHPRTVHIFEREIVDAWLDEQVRAEEPTVEELEAHFQEHIDAFRAGEGRVTYILLTTSKERAQTLRERALSAPEGERLDRFRQLAEDFSLDRPSGSRRGLVGGVTETGEVVATPEIDTPRPPDDWTGEFAEVPWDLEEGAISEPLERDGRWLLVTWSGTVPPEEIAFEDVIQDVREHYLQKKREEIVAKLRD